jgi:hypothetical protein
MPRVELRQLFWLGAATAVAVAALVAVVGIVRGHFSDTDARILGSAFAVFLCGSTALAALALINRRQALPLAWPVLIGLPVALVLMLGQLWTWVDEGPVTGWANPAWTAFLAVLAALVATTLRLLLSRPGLVRTLWPVVVVCAGGAAGIGSALIWTNGGHDTLGRTAAALTVLAVAGYLLGPIAQRLAGRRPLRQGS